VIHPQCSLLRHRLSLDFHKSCSKKCCFWRLNKAWPFRTRPLLVEVLVVSIFVIADHRAQSNEEDDGNARKGETEYLDAER
jgi:hypothetical protein